MWESILTAPFLHMLELAVLDEGTMHSLVPLRKDSGRVEARFVDVSPTHWRHWGERDEEA